MPYIRLSGFYFFYFALLGAMIPYWSLYLQSLSFDAATIGVLMATLHFSRIFAPALWGWLADRTGKRIVIIQNGALLTCICFVAMFWQENALGIGIVMLAYSFFWNAVLPQMEVVTLQHLGARKSRYSRIRLWGSIGFILAVMAVGKLLDAAPIAILLWVLMGLMVLIWLNALMVPTLPQHKTEQQGEANPSFMQVMCQPQVMMFFLITLLVQFSHGAYYTFYSVLLEQYGYSRLAIGGLWSLGVVAEVGIFLVMHLLIERFGLRLIMLISLCLCVIRWLAIGLGVESLAVLLLAQLLHAATFGSLHSVGIALVHHYFPAHATGRGQAMFSSIGFGIGGSLGALLAGFMWDSLGAALTFSVSAGFAAVAIVLAYVWIHPEKAQQLGD